MSGRRNRIIGTANGQEGMHTRSGAGDIAGTFGMGFLALGIWWFVYRGLSPFSKWFTFSLLGLLPKSRLGTAVEFFVFDAPKVLMLLVLVVFAVGVVRSFFTPETARRLLAGNRETAGNILAAMLGVATPFCSCSAVPLFIGFVTSGVPLGFGADG